MVPASWPLCCHYAEDRLRITRASTLRGSVLLKSSQPLSAEQLENRLDEILDAIINRRRTASVPARSIATPTATQQAFVLHWVEVLAHTNAEIAFQFAANVARAFAQMPAASVEEWVVKTLDSYDKQGMLDAIAVLQNVDEFARIRALLATGLPLANVAGVLFNFVNALGGRAFILHHHRRRDQGLSAAHVRGGELCRGRRRAQTAAESVRHLPQNHLVTTIYSPATR
jgi:hypothetical protein